MANEMENIGDPREVSGNVITFPGDRARRTPRQVDLETLANVIKATIADGRGIRPVPPEKRCTRLEMLQREFPGEDPAKLERMAAILEKINSIIDSAEVAQ